MRTITTHQCHGDPHADKVLVQAEEHLGPGGAPHYYQVQSTDVSDSCHIHFQYGPINEAGANGITMEALLAVCADRLEHFQAGPYPCDENAQALSFIQAAIRALHARTSGRLARQVEGTSKA